MEFESPRFAGDPSLEEILNDPDTGTKKLQKGSNPDAVRKVQQALFDLGWSVAVDPPITAQTEFVDGDYGPRTTKVVLAYKTHYNLRYPPGDPNGFIDGFAGPRTLRKLDPQCVLLDEAIAAIEPKILELQASGLDFQPAQWTHIFDSTPGAFRPATIAGTDGGIFYKRGVGAFEVHGAIFVAYTTEYGSAEGELGYPTSDEADNPDRPGGRISRFEHGSLLWDEEAGVSRGTEEELARDGVIPGEVVVRFKPDKPIPLVGEAATLVGLLESLGLSSHHLPGDWETIGPVALDQPLDLTDEEAASFEEAAHLNGVAWEDPRRLLILKFPPVVDPELVAASLGQLDEVEKAEVHYWVTPSALPNDPLVGDSDKAGTVTVGGITYKTQWYIFRSRGDRAWAMTSGKNTIIAVLDAGFVTDHQDLKANIDSRAAINIVDNLSDVGRGSLEDINHGTGVMGFAGAAGNNSKGIAGFAYDARLWPIQITTVPPPGSPRPSGRSSIRDDSIARAILHVIRQPSSERKVINISAGIDLGTVGRNLETSSIDWAAIFLAWLSNIPVFISAGNEQSDTGAPIDRPSLPNCVVVASTAYHESRNARASYSNFGPRVDVCASGDGNRDVTCWFDAPWWESMGGTSGATPKVAGTGALMLSVNPQLKAADVRNILRTIGARPDYDSDEERNQRPIGVFLNAETAVTEAKRRLLTMQSINVGLGKLLVTTPNTFGNVRGLIYDPTGSTTGLGLDPAQNLTTLKTGQLAPGVSALAGFAAAGLPFIAAYSVLTGAVSIHSLDSDGVPSQGTASSMNPGFALLVPFTHSSAQHLLAYEPVSGNAEIYVLDTQNFVVVGPVGHPKLRPGLSALVPFTIGTRSYILSFNPVDQTHDINLLNGLGTDWESTHSEAVVAVRTHYLGYELYGRPRYLAYNAAGGCHVGCIGWDGDSFEEEFHGDFPAGYAALLGFSSSNGPHCLAYSPSAPEARIVPLLSS